MDSRISGFYKLPLSERLSRVSSECGLEKEDARAFSEGLSLQQADRMIENVVGLFQLPVGVAVNFRLNDRDILVPMACEEPSVVAAASNAAKMVRAGGGFKTSSTEPVMVGQIQVVDAKEKAGSQILEAKKGLIDKANKQDPTLVGLGGGALDLEVRQVSDMLVIHLKVDVRDAMGANAVNAMCEALSPEIEEISGGEVVLKILSNYAVDRTASATACVPVEEVGGKEVAERIVWAQKLAEEDIYRAVTHNKGVMNGVSSVVSATGNDTRAVEAGCHSYAARDGSYKPLSSWKLEGSGLFGSLTIPCAIGVVGGATKTHPVAKACVKVLGVKTAKELGEVLAAVGLAQNLGALRALAAEGIQRGHMRLHARNIAVTAGAKEEEVDEVAKEMVEKCRVSVDEAKKIINKKK